MKKDEVKSINDDDECKNCFNKEVINFLSNLNINEMVSNYYKYNEKKNDQNKSYHSYRIKYFLIKYLKEILTLTSVLFVIVYLSRYGFLEKSTIGTLLGSVIGYTIGNLNFNKNNSQK